MQSPVAYSLASLALVSGLVFPPHSAYTAVYVALGAALLGMIWFWRRLSLVLANRTMAGLALAFTFLAITLPFVWQGPEDLFSIAFLLPIPIGAGVAVLLDAEPRLARPGIIGAFCFVGALGALAIGLNDIFVLNLGRAGGTNNPIHFAGIATVLGYGAVMAVFDGTSKWRFIFLAGPALALGAAVTSGSRGPILANAVLALVLLPLVIFWFRRNWVARAAPLVFIVLAAVPLFVVAPSLYDRALNAVVSSTEVVTSLLPTVAEPADLQADGSISERMVLLNGAWRAFLDSPLYGHGSSRLISAPAAYFPPKYAGLGNHMHSDMADFAVIGGAIGLLAYLMVLVSAFLPLRGMPQGETRNAMIVGALAIGGGGFLLGLTNAFIGILPQTALFGLLLGCLIAFRRSASASRPATT